MDNPSRSTKENSIYSLTNKYLMTSVRQHREFLWHIRHFIVQENKEDAVRGAVLQYQKFVALSSSLQPVCPVPTYPILWIWKTHMLRGIVNYIHDCRILRGGGSTQLIPNDLVYDRCTTSMSHWWQTVHDTQRHWKAVYGEDYGVDEDMDRGLPSADFYLCSWKPGPSARWSNQATQNNRNDNPYPGTTVHEPSGKQILALPNRTGAVLGPTKTSTSIPHSKRPKKRYQRIIESLRTRNKHHDAPSEPHKEPLQHTTKRRYQVFLEHRRRQPCSQGNETH